MDQNKDLPELEKTHGNNAEQNADIQGEGNYDASRNYRRGLEEFVDSGKVDEAADAAEPRSREEAEELERAEEAAREGHSLKES